MLNQNRLIKTCGLVICFFGMCGCGQIETIAKRQIQKEADIQSLEEYVNYESIKQNEDYSVFLNDYDVNEDTGEVVKKDNNPSIIDDGKIKVSFADNNHLKVSYFLDKERKNPISTKYIYLNPGDTLYYSDPEIIHAYTSEFEFNGFDIKKYDNDTVSSETIQQSVDGLLYRIPEDFSGDRLTILPIGHYNLRTLNLSANYKDENGSHELSGGKWSINNAIYTGNSASIESAVPFTVKYDYSTYLNDYYVESTSPEAFGIDSQLGIVEFKQSSPIDSNRDYSVTMHRLIDVELINKYYDGDIRDVTKADNVISFLSINDEELSIEKKHKKVYSGYKVGQRIRIVVNKDYKVTGTGITISEPADVNDGKEYILTINNIKNNKVNLIVSKVHPTDGAYEQKTMKNATVSLVYKRDNSEIVDGDEVDSKERVVVQILPDEGYYLSGKSIKNEMYREELSFEQYNEKIDKIIADHPSNPYIVVDLNNEDSYGIVSFKKGKDVISGEHSFKNGEEVTLTYKITNSDYKIKRDGFHPFSSPSEESRTIKIDDSMNQQSINREDYIEITKK